MFKEVNHTFTLETKRDGVYWVPTYLSTFASALYSPSVYTVACIRGGLLHAWLHVHWA